MEQAIRFAQYDKISDDLCLLGYNTIFRFNVSLSKKGNDGNRYGFHKEFEYSSDKFNGEKLLTIRRTFDYFLSIENLKPNEYNTKEFIMIGLKDIYYFKQRITEASRWFIDKEFENLFASSKGKLVMLGKVNPIEITGLAMDKYLLLEPIVYGYENRVSPGIRIYLSSVNNFVDISVDRFMGFAYLVDKIDMYQSAQLLLNYLQRPEYGTNLYRFNHGPTCDDMEVTISNNNTRKIPSSNKQKSFFDKMDEL